MSATTEKVPLLKAQAMVEDFARLFPAWTHERWQVAGSVRRGKPFVGDLEFVIIPTFGDVPAGDADLFGNQAKERRNLLWTRVDELVALSTLIRVETDADAGTRACWGERQRRVLFRGVQVELYTCDARSWGMILAIRTGPAGFSKMMVEQIRKQTPPYACAGGYVRRLTGKPREREAEEPIVDCPTEEAFFGMCGVRYLAPESRRD